MSGDARDTVWGRKGQPPSGLTLAQRYVALAIADVANDAHDYEFWMASKNLAIKCEMSASNVRNRLSELVDLGWIEVLEVGVGRGSATRYRWIGKPHSGNALPDEKVHSDNAGGAFPQCTNADRTSYRTEEEPDDAHASSSVSAKTANEDDTKATAQDITRAYWDWVKRETGHEPPTPFMGIRAVVKAALDADFTRPQIKQGLAGLRKRGRPITKPTLWEEMLDGAGKPRRVGVNAGWVDLAEDDPAVVLARQNMADDKARREAEAADGA